MNLKTRPIGIVLAFFLTSVPFNLMPAICSSTTMVYVDPTEVLGVRIGDTFDVYVTASDVVDLFLVEFFLSWDPLLLETDVDNINPGDVEPYLEFIYVEEVDNDEGWLRVVSGRPLGVFEGLSGIVQLAKITFLVEAEGSCDLHFFDSPATPEVDPTLLDVFGYDIECTTEDGYFSNLPIGEPPVASFTYTPKEPIVDETVTFDASASYDPDGTILSYFWDFGDGTNGTGVTTTHAYAIAGVYTVTLVVTDNDGLTAAVTATLTVVPPPGLYLADLVKRSAWPEHHHYDVSKEAVKDRHGTLGYQTLYGKVCNIGNATTIVKVVFTISDEEDVWTTIVETGIATIVPGQITDLTYDLDPGMLPSIPGKYYVSAQCWYDADGDGIIDEAGAKVKTFSFAVVP